MIHFTKNEGQYHPNVAYVAKVTDEMKNRYQGTGVVELLAKGNGFADFKYAAINVISDVDGAEIGGVQFTREELEDESPAVFDAKLKGRFHAVASCWEICIDHGTAAAAFLNLVGDHA